VLSAAIKLLIVGIKLALPADPIAQTGTLQDLLLAKISY
jgi:hypothetical protein